MDWVAPLNRDSLDESTIPFSTPAVKIALGTHGPLCRPYANADELLLNGYTHPSPRFCGCSNPVDARWIYTNTKIRGSVHPAVVKHLLAIAACWSLALGVSRYASHAHRRQVGPDTRVDGGVQGPANLDRRRITSGRANSSATNQRQRRRASRLLASRRPSEAYSRSFHVDDEETPECQRARSPSGVQPWLSSNPRRICNLASSGIDRFPFRIERAANQTGCADSSSVLAGICLLDLARA
jgi:hypothetical protein